MPAWKKNLFAANAAARRQLIVIQIILIGSR